MRNKDLWLLCALLLAANVSLLWGGPNPALIYFPAKVQAGEWWRLLSHPFVHVGGFHWLFDGSAFLSLYVLLPKSVGKRLSYLLASATGSLMAAQLGTVDLDQFGFCGLSGICHGLLAVVLVTLWQDCSETATMRFGALFLLAGLVGKCLFEAYTGEMPWLGLYANEVGAPVTTCHLGGMLAGLLLFFGLRFFDKIAVNCSKFTAILCLKGQQNQAQ